MTALFKKIKILNLLVLIISIYFALILIELLFIITDLDKKSNMTEIIKVLDEKKKKENFDNRNLVEFYLNLKKKGKNIELSTTSTGYNTHLDPSFMFKDEFKVFPLSGISNSNTVLCNENGYFATYTSDNYGFNNPTNWKSKYDYVILGDSFVEGFCVNEKNNLAGNLKKLTKKENVLNLGRGGNGPLKNYAILREYIDLVDVKNIIYIHTSGNDIQDLFLELKNKILIKYILDKDFNQNLAELQFLIDDQLDKKLSDFILRYKKIENENIDNKKESFIKFLKLHRTIRFKNKVLRSISNRKEEMKETNTFSKENILDDFINKEFKSIISLINDVGLMKNINFYFVYIPSYYSDPKTINKKEKIIVLNDQYYESIIKVVNDLNIPLIDLKKILLEEYTDPLSLLPFRFYGHFNEKGNELIANILLKEISLRQKNF